MDSHLLQEATYPDRQSLGICVLVAVYSTGRGRAMEFWNLDCVGTLSAHQGSSVPVAPGSKALLQYIPLYLTYKYVPQVPVISYPAMHNTSAAAVDNPPSRCRYSWCAC